MSKGSGKAQLVCCAPRSLNPADDRNTLRHELHLGAILRTKRCAWVLRFVTFSQSSVLWYGGVTMFVLLHDYLSFLQYWIEPEERFCRL